MSKEKQADEQVMPKEKQANEQVWVKNISRGQRGFHYRTKGGDLKRISLPREVKVVINTEIYAEMSKNAPFLKQVKNGDFEVSHTFK